MRSDLYLDLYLKEDTYWWHVAKRRLVESLIKKYRPFSSKAEELKLLDVGCGTGRIIELLQQFGEAWGVDWSDHALEFCRKRGHNKVSKQNLEEPLSFPEDFDVITALDVIEHLEGDVATLRNLRRNLKPGGILIISVPAFQFLFSYWDVALGHKKRYTRKQLIAVVEEAGFSVVKCSYTNFFIFFPAVAVRLVKSLVGLLSKKVKPDLLSKDSDFITLPKILNDFLIKLYDIERKLVLARGLPLGLSAVVVCQKDAVG